MARARASAAEWAVRVESWRASGESAAAFAARGGWSPQTLTWWGRQHGGAKRREITSRGASFVQLVERREPEHGGSALSALEVVLPRGATARISAATDLALLRAVVDALGAR